MWEFLYFALPIVGCLAVMHLITIKLEARMGLEYNREERRHEPKSVGHSSDDSTGDTNRYLALVQHEFTSCEPRQL